MACYRVSVDGHEYIVEIVDLQRRPIVATVEGETFEVTVEPQGIADTSPAAPVVTALRPSVAPVEALRAAPVTSASAAGGAVTAPLPGTIVAVSVMSGDRVDMGQELCVLEAMKMNNPIRSTRSGVITEVSISVGQQVQHGQTLMLIAEG